MRSNRRITHAQLASFTYTRPDILGSLMEAQLVPKKHRAIHLQLTRLDLADPTVTAEMGEARRVYGAPMVVTLKRRRPLRSEAEAQ
jgi:hypothetical protein